ncbi:MAG: type II secretion system F family protein [Armatimonadota bacterium]
MSANHEPIGLVDLTIYLRQFSILIGAGVSLMRSLSILQRGLTSDPLRAVNVEIMRQIEAGETLSKAMCTDPPVFTPFLIGMVRAGEVGGVLDITLDRAADFYQRQLDNRRQRFIQYATAQVLGHEREEQFEAAMEDLQDKLMIEYFCTMLGTLLGSGVPILQALEVSAQMLPERPAQGVAQACANLREGSTTIIPPLAAAGFPPGVVTMLSVGEETGTLDRLALRAGELLGAEIEGRLQTALGLN